MQPPKMNRRNYLKKSLVGTAGAVFAPTIVPSSVFGKDAPSNKINVGQIGFGCIAKAHDLPEMMKYDVAWVVAVCNVDHRRKEDGKYYDEGYFPIEATTVGISRLQSFLY